MFQPSAVHEVMGGPGNCVRGWANLYQASLFFLLFYSPHQHTEEQWEGSALVLTLGNQRRTPLPTRSKENCFDSQPRGVTVFLADSPG